ncbi:peptidyl-prolyl cis-trans isomerase NIMA-interacting 4 [Prunus yedoensis var. nudiflora]|uniref:Peptidyl-prolyl cis-trans isomerase n=1 Tax=Prunus yedoensis var. nudiflora TaxID=2094558 RepID=A0A314UCX0_PRUYE|nr:peptidyl-prolyl cis-trans isomerase NIMA-interacting 4 [Prunus yedoensis var. nudiflora]
MRSKNKRANFEAVVTRAAKAAELNPPQSNSNRLINQKDGEGREGGRKRKGKQAAGGSDEAGSKGKGKSGKSSDGLGTCTYVKARHVLCEKQGKINEAYKKLQDGWLENGDKVPPAEFAKVAAEYSECPSGKKGGDLGWFPRGKMAGPFQEVAFATPIGATSAPFKSTHGTILSCAKAERIKTLISDGASPNFGRMNDVY